MRVIEIDGSQWASVADFCNALCSAIGAPDWHGSSVDALIDSIVVHDDINAVKAPYTIRVSNTIKLPSKVKAEIEMLVSAVNKAAALDQGTDLEVNIQIVS